MLKNGFVINYIFGAFLNSYLMNLWSHETISFQLDKRILMRLLNPEV